MPLRRHLQPTLLVITAFLLATAAAASAAMYHTPRRAAFAAAAGASSSTKGWLRNPAQRTFASRFQQQSRRPSSLGFLSAVTMLAAPRGGWATTSIPTTGTAAAAAGFCPAPFSTASGAPPQTCMAASASSTAVAAPPTDASAKKKLQPKYRLSYRPPDYWIRHTDLTFQIEADPVRGVGGFG